MSPSCLAACGGPSTSWRGGAGRPGQPQVGPGRICQQGWPAGPCRSARPARTTSAISSAESRLDRRLSSSGRAAARVQGAIHPGGAALPQGTCSSPARASGRHGLSPERSAMQVGKWTDRSWRTKADQLELIDERRSPPGAPRGRSAWSFNRFRNLASSSAGPRAVAGAWGEDIAPARPRPPAGWPCGCAAQQYSPAPIVKSSLDDLRSGHLLRPNSTVLPAARVSAMML